MMHNWLSRKGFLLSLVFLAFSALEIQAQTEAINQVPIAQISAEFIRNGGVINHHRPKSG